MGNRDDPVLLVSIQDQENRKIIKQYIPDDLDLEVSTNGIDHRAYDLYIVDEQSFHKKKQKLKRIKQEVAPIFLPVLLLSPSQDSVRKSSSAIQIADDVLYTPVSSELLAARIKMLLQQREYSLKLEQQNKELAREKQKYQLIAENASDMISRHAPDGTYWYVSPASEELIGFSPNQLEGKNVFDRMHPEDRQRILDDRAKYFMDTGVERWSFRYETKCGSYKWVETTLRAIKDNTGDVTEVQASTRDISARKKYERKLEEEKKFINKTIESLPELFFLIDEEQNFVRWNNIESQLGYSDEEIQNMHPLDFYREKDHEFIQSKITEAFTEGNAEAEVRMKAKNGNLVPFYVTARNFSRGGTEFIVGSCINLTDIKEAQFKFEKQRRLLDAIINQTQSVIYVKDQDRKYRLVNDSYLELFSLERAQVIGKTDKKVHGANLDQEIAENDLKVLNTGQTVEVEERIPVDGEIRLYHTIKYPLTGVPGFESCVCGISTDITDLKKATSKLEERIKEQRCLYNISSLSQKDYNISQLLSEAVTLLPDGWQYPEIAEAAIEFDGNRYKTEGYRDTEWKLKAESNRIPGKSLMVEIIYTENKGLEDEGVFLSEERQLIDSITETLSSKIDRILAQDKLKESKKRWEMLVKNDPNLIQILVDREIKFINQSGAEMYGAESPDELIGKNSGDLISVEDEEKVIQREKKLAKGKKVEPTINKVTGIDGKVRYIKTYSMPITYQGHENAIQVVGQDISNRIRYEEQLKESIREKEVLLQEIHHRVKNNLAVVSGLLTMQRFDSKEERLNSVLYNCERRIKSIALIHEKLYNSESLSQVDFKQYIKDLLSSIGNIIDIRDDISFKLSCEDVTLNVNQAVPCGLIISELISNAFEHGFPNKSTGWVSVDLAEEDNMISVKVSDSGLGLPENVLKGNSKSMGFKIIETLINQLDASLNIQNREKGGTTISFSFEKQEIRGSVSSFVSSSDQ